jgi:hypothetical protein
MKKETKTEAKTKTASFMMKGNDEREAGGVETVRLRFRLTAEETKLVTDTGITNRKQLRALFASVLFALVNFDDVKDKMLEICTPGVESIFNLEMEIKQAEAEEAAAKAKAAARRAALNAKLEEAAKAKAA